MINMRWLIDYIRSCFCIHVWELIFDTTVKETYNGIPNNTYQVKTYRCKKCGYEIVPTYFQALNAMHMGTTRYLKCPNCKKRSWCKKVIK